MTESTAGRLALAVTQLDVTDERIREHGIAADDLLAVATYLHAVTDHCVQIAELAMRAIDHAEPTHPVQATGHGMSVQVALGHVSALAEITMHFASAAEQDLQAMDRTAE